MADNKTQIDELCLDITINKDNSADKKVRSLASALNRLNNIVGAFDSQKFTNLFTDLTKGIQPFINTIKGAEKALTSLSKVMSKGGFNSKVKELALATDIKIGKETVPNPSAQYGEAKPFPKPQPLDEKTIDEISRVMNSASNATKDIANNSQTAQDKIKGITNLAELLKIKLQQTRDALKNSNLTEEQALSLKQRELNLQQQINQLEGKRTVPFQSLIRSFARIATYRVFRVIIKNIAQSFRESIAGIARYNDKFNDSMSSVSSSVAQMRTAVGVGLYQTLMIIEPLITGLSSVVTTLGNSFSYLTAKLTGASTYMKVNTKYLKDYRSQLDGTLLSFDTFTTLGKGQGIDYSQMLEEVSIDEGVTEGMRTILTLIKAIAAVLITIAGTKLALWIAGGGIAKITEGLAGVITKIKGISTAGVIAGSAFAFIFTIANLIEVIANWDSQSLITKITAITAALLGVAAVVFSILAATGVGSVKVMKAIAIGATASATLMGLVSAMKFANGGMMTMAGTGTMYAIAGEAGAEVVAQGSNGTGVLNVQQFTEAMFNALTMYGAARDSGGNTIIELDGNRVGEAVARSSGFRNEINRRNANLNIR